jgi:hypothetical protein
MTEIEERLRGSLHELGDAYEPSEDLPRRITDLIDRGAVTESRGPRSVHRIQRRRWATGFVMLGVVVVAISAAIAFGPRSAAPGGRSHSTSGRQPITETTPQLRRALRIWSGFPVSTWPRPLILLGNQVDAPSGGFPDDASKIAFDAGAINVPETFPSGPPTVGGLPLISARTAFAFFKSTAGKGPSATVDLNVRSVKLGTAVFETDRGYHTLPAWLFSFRGIQNPAAVLAVARAAFFSPTGLPPNGPPATLGARLSSDGRTLTVIFGGAPWGTGPCDLEYSLGSAVSKTGVALQLNARQVDKDRNAVCAMPGTGSQIVMTLSAPLGNRVVIDAANGAPVPVEGASISG